MNNYTKCCADWNISRYRSDDTFAELQTDPQTQKYLYMIVSKPIRSEQPKNKFPDQ